MHAVTTPHCNADEKPFAACRALHEYRTFTAQVFNIQDVVRTLPCQGCNGQPPGELPCDPQTSLLGQQQNSTQESLLSDPAWSGRAKRGFLEEMALS